MTRMGEREIGAVSGRLPDNSGEFACMLRDRSFIRGGGGGGLVQMGWGYTFCAPENGGLHKIVQPFLRGMYFCALHFPFHKKETTVKESNISYFQNDGITNQHNMVYSSPFTLQKKLHVLLSIT